MTVTLNVTGSDAVRKALESASKEIRDEVSDAIFDFATDVQQGIVESINKGPKTGQVYDSIFRSINGRAVPVAPRSGSGLSATHQASAPGQPPASDTGRLASSITLEEEGQFTVTVSAKAKYAAYLEYGTRTIAPRPFMVPAKQKAEPAFKEALEIALKDLL